MHEGLGTREGPAGQQRFGAWERAGRGFNSLPVPVRLAVTAVAGAGLLLAIFFAVVWPLLDNTGPVQAEVDGVLPAQATVGRPLTMDLEITSTGDQTINPVCVQASFSKPVDFESVDFQGIETIRAVGGRVCGGMLATQESISIEVLVVPRAAGAVDGSVTPTQGSRAIGPALTGTIQVTNP
ncbi:MAG TPA: hypothetical protein VEK76_00845 [Candidatus Binatia bacterium]|nr:hypothetical protein [Candidatus Binatia bacterium]